MSNTVIAIDGPSASGKSTVAKKAASLLGYLYVDSGAVYRAATLLALRKGIAADAESCARLLDSAGIECFVRDGAVWFRVGGIAPDRQLRSDEVNENVSRVSAVPEVRAKVGLWLRRALSLGSLVMEGRDIGAAVFPRARHKFYLDADPAERARRRAAEMAASGTKADVGAVRDSLSRRDSIDSSRRQDPLKIAPDAVVIDTTSMSADEVAARIVELVLSGKP